MIYLIKAKMRQLWFIGATRDTQVVPGASYAPPGQLKKALRNKQLNDLLRYHNNCVLMA